MTAQAVVVTLPRPVIDFLSERVPRNEGWKPAPAPDCCMSIVSWLQGTDYVQFEPVALVKLTARLQASGASLHARALEDLVRVAGTRLSSSCLADGVNQLDACDREHFLQSGCSVALRASCFPCPLCGQWSEKRLCQTRVVAPDGWCWPSWFPDSLAVLVGAEVRSWCSACSARIAALDPATLILRSLELHGLPPEAAFPWTSTERYLVDAAVAGLPPQHLADGFNQLSEPALAGALRSPLGRRLRDSCFICPICARWMDRAAQQACASGHSWCSECFRSWVAQPGVIHSMIERRSLSPGCLYGRSGGGCEQELPEALVRNAKVPELSCLIRDMDRRRFFISRAGHRACIECQNPNCVGVAYGGSFRRMCFVCEEQWVVGQNTLLACLAGVLECYLEGGVLSGTNMRRCPACGVPIEKNGGCNHMTCHCGCHFDWRTGARLPIGQPAYE
uniref:RING-type domain-containing protein n=1 Tax=Alexandrium monilatum TaxID=311494 RepID=A0A7S4WCP3_9DINO